MENDRIIRILFVGEKGSGKSSIISTFLFKHPVLPKKPIIFGSYCRDVILHGQNLKVFVCDTNGEHDFVRSLEMSFLEADLVAICVDITARSSLERAELYARESIKSNIPRVLVLTKTDLLTEIDEKKYSKFVKKFGLNGYVKINSLQNKSVKKAFEMLIEIASDEVIMQNSNCFACCMRKK